MINTSMAYHDLISLNRRCQCYVETEEYDVVPAFADDRLTVCSKNQEAALNSLRQSYGAGYGKPIPGSASDKRGQEYQRAVTMEVMGLCRIIFNHGFRLGNGHTLMLFREIFDLYQSISNKVVGILARARKNRLIHFEGETLFQGQSDAINVTLLRNIADIEQHYKTTKELLYNEDAKNLFVIRLRNAIYNTFCVSMNFVDEMIIDKDEGCDDLEPLEMIVGTAELSDHVSTTPPLSPPPLKSDVEVKTAKKKLVIEPTPIRLNKGLRSFDSPRENRVVLDFGSSSLVSSAVE